MLEKLLRLGGRTKIMEVVPTKKEIVIDIGNLMNPQVWKHAKELDETGIRDAGLRITKISYIPKETFKEHESKNHLT